MQILDFFLKNSQLNDEIARELDHRRKVHLLDRMRKIKLTLSLCFIFGTIVFLTGIARCLSIYPLIDSKLSILFIICIYFYLLPFIYRIIKNDYLLRILLLVGGVTGIVLRSLSTSGITSSPFYWLTLVPLSSALIFEKKMIIWSLIGSIILSLIIFYGEQWGLFIGPPNNPSSNFAGFIGLLISSTLTAVAFDRQATNFQEQMIKQEKEVQDSKKLASLGNMAAGVAHEVNNPLMVIAGNLRQLERSVEKLNIDQEDHLKIINYISKATNNISRINNIVQSLLAYGRMKSKENFRTFSLDTFFENLKKIIEENGEVHSIQWPQIDNNAISLLGDETLLTQVFTNLIFNAWQATSHLKDAHITVTSKATLEYIIFKIIDQGKIENPEVLDNMFNPFFTTKPIGQGTGLGLSLSKGIIEMHGGELYYDNSYPTTCFVVKLPCKAF